MGLFTRRRGAQVTADAEWMPVDGVTELEGGDANMDDDGQATDGPGYFAYEVEHEMPNLPGARITIWTYVCYIGDAAYGVGLRYQYTHEDDPGWFYVGYAADPEGEEFGTNPDADATAADWAGAIADRPGDWQARLPNVFDWDGAPFPVDVQE